MRGRFDRDWLDGVLRENAWFAAFVLIAVVVALVVTALR
jgi:hypothetical protein